MGRHKISWAVKRAVIERDGPFCRYCGETSEMWGWRRDARGALRPWLGHPLQLDHVLPGARGGASSLANLVVACEHCNKSKWIHGAPPMRAPRPVVFPDATLENVVCDHFQPFYG